MNLSAIEIFNKTPTYAAYLEDFERAQSAYCLACSDWEHYPRGSDCPESQRAAERFFFATDSVIAAQNALMKAPAPDMAAIAFKLELLAEYMEETESDDSHLRNVRRAVDAAKAGDSRITRKYAARVVKWANGQCGGGMECPEKTILADLERLSANSAA
jgi:hypothetical protein